MASFRGGREQNAVVAGAVIEKKAQGELCSTE